MKECGPYQCEISVKLLKLYFLEESFPSSCATFFELPASIYLKGYRWSLKIGSWCGLGLGIKAADWLKDGLLCPKMLILPGCITEEILFLKKDCKMGRHWILNLSQDLQGISIPEPFRRPSLRCQARDHSLLIYECTEDSFLLRGHC